MDNRAAFVFNHLLLSSSEESSDDNEYVRIARGNQVLRPRIQNYVTGVVELYNNREFRENFRMYRETFNHILSILGEELVPNNTGRTPVPAKHQLLFTIWYFATPDCYRSICSCFNIGKATALRTVRRVTDAILNISNTVIKWPVENYQQTIKDSFHKMGFPNTIGALDGCYIPVPQPKENGLSYICRKNFPALILQGVCHHRLLFTHCYVGEVGSTHDANVLRRSELINFLTNGRLQRFPNDSHLVGDKAYPCLPTLMVPFKDNGRLTNDQKHFNYSLSRVRSTIERAFGLLKKRFICLKFFDIKDIEWACKYIMACCVLHNICILQNDILDFELIEENEDDDNLVPSLQEVDRNLHRLGSIKRDNICEMLRQ